MKHFFQALLFTIAFFAAQAVCAELEAFSVPHPKLLVIDCGR